MDLYNKFPWLRGLKTLAEGLVTSLHEKEKNYEGSWQKRGGVGAFMMLARKWDRIEAISKRHGYNLFSALRDDDSGIIDDVDDLISYLMLARSHPETSPPADLPAKQSGMENPFGYVAEDEVVPAYTRTDPLSDVRSPRLEEDGVVAPADKPELQQDAGPAGAAPTPPPPLENLPELDPDTVRIRQGTSAQWADIPVEIWKKNRDSYTRNGWSVVQEA